MSSIIRMRNGVIGGLLRKLPAGTAPALGSYPQQSCPTMSRLYGEAVQSNGHLRQLLNPPPPGYRIDITRKNPSYLPKTKDVVLQAIISHNFGTQ